jgi:acyl carrier protein
VIEETNAPTVNETVVPKLPDGLTSLVYECPMNIEETLKAHIGKELISGEKTDLDLDTDLIGLVDSTGVMELTVWIESTFGFSVEIDDITPENFGTIRRLADWIRRNSTQPAE